MMQRLSILGAMASTSLRAEFQYRANVVTSMISGMLYQLTGFVVIWIIVARFNTIGGWSLAEITFLYGMRLTSHGIFYACFSQLFELDRVLISGEYDRYLVRPMSPLAQLFTRKLRMNAFGDLIGGALLLAFAIRGVGADWTLAKAGLLLAAVVGGALIEGAVQIVLGSFSFRVLNALALRTTTNEVFNLYGNYPTHIFPNLIEYLLTFALPVAFVAYFPASAILGRGDQLTVAPAIAWLAPILGIVLFSFAVRVWRWQSKRYQSAGN
jgi:ABC-2 type transport system permease protein